MFPHLRRVLCPEQNTGSSNLKRCNRQVAGSRREQNLWGCCHCICSNAVVRRVAYWTVLRKSITKLRNYMLGGPCMAHPPA